MKKIIVILLISAILASCGKAALPTVSDSAANTSEAYTSETAAPPAETDVPEDTDNVGETSFDVPDTLAPTTDDDFRYSEDNLVIACDQNLKRIAVYDMDLVRGDGDLDEAEIWSYTGVRTASVKYRENTVYGDVVITSSYTAGPTIIEYPSKNVIWCGGAECAGDNPHSVEILPSGNMLSAASSGGTVRLYNNVNITSRGYALKYKTYELSGAHGLLYDPDNNYVWALGSRELVAYDVIDNGDGTESLRQVEGLGGILPGRPAGHDLSADLTDSRYLWITSAYELVRYDKKENKFEIEFPESEALSRSGLKGFGNNKNNNFIYCFPNGGVGREWEGSSIASWSTDTLHYAVWEGNKSFDIKAYTSERSAFYKVRIFYGGYR